MKNRWATFSLFLLALIAGLVFVSRGTASAPAVDQIDLSAPRLLGAPPVPELGAHAFISALITPEGAVQVLVEKNAKLRWPIASITKLFTASVAWPSYLQNEIVTLSPADLPEVYDSGYFRSGERFYSRDLFSSLLLESSNNAAVILSRQSANGDFIKRMNALATGTGLHDTAFFNPNGLDPAASSGTNYSSVYDLTLFTKWLLTNRPGIFPLTRQAAVTIRQADGTFHHQIKSTNELLTSQPWSSEIIGGKTGSTDLAGKNLLLVLQVPKGHLVNIVLGSPDHFLDMRTLTNWVFSVYQV